MAARQDPLNELANRFLARGDKVVTAESCTGGLLASCLTSVPGSSAWFEGSFVTYSIAAKHRMLGIPMQVIEAHGAVSASGRVMGCYLHGLFSSDPFRHRFLDAVRRRAASGVAHEQRIEETLDALADHLGEHIDVEALVKAARG